MEGKVFTKKDAEWVIKYLELDKSFWWCLFHKIKWNRLEEVKRKYDVV